MFNDEVLHAREAPAHHDAEVEVAGDDLDGVLVEEQVYNYVVEVELADSHVLRIPTHICYAGTVPILYSNVLLHHTHDGEARRAVQSHQME